MPMTAWKRVRMDDESLDDFRYGLSLVAKLVKSFDGI
ncbi:hypothetical protein Rcae01_01952 [Novipirellula caenicola]|uniref:Uncharacterized protein n=1 Tax=Novipirellula caenicola TaxID=1536901 RepID=A0ABP9VMT9_9BACT